MNCKNKSFMTKRKAFTLIELLIVIAIIGILFIVLVSKVDFATDKAKATGVQTDFRSFQMAFDTVAKENAGFNTFGWDTGDANQDGIRNSYDEGDNGAGGGIAKNGIQDGTEVFTGHKVYAETFTKVFSLKKNGTGSYDRDALNRLETAINANLDPKLHITIKDDGEIVMANGAQDPWNKEYHGYYISNAENDGKDRGAIVMYSDGANNEFGSEHTITNGVVSISVPGSNKNGKDDYSIVSMYTYVNGYGEVVNITSGFSNNQSFLGNNQVNVQVVPGGGNTPGEETPDTPDTPESVEYSIIRGANQTIVLDAEHAEFVSNADFSKFEKVVVDTTDLVENEHYTVRSGSTVVTLKPTFIATLSVGEHTMYVYSEDGVATCKFYIEPVPEHDEVVAVFDKYLTNPTCHKSNFYHTDACWTSEVNELTWEELLTASNGIKYGYDVSAISETMIGEAAFKFCDGLTSFTFPDTMLVIGDYSFCGTRLVNVNIPDNVTTIGTYAFDGWYTESVTIGKNVETIGEWAFTGDYLETISVHSENSKYYSVNNCLIEKATKTLRFGCSNSVIPADGSVTNIGNGAFYSRQNLTSITIPDTIISIGDMAFAYCSNLTSVVIGKNVETFGTELFYECVNLTSIRFNGTKSMWNNIEKDGDKMWKWQVPAMYAYCTDGNVLIGELNPK